MDFEAMKVAQLWLHESERVYCDRLVNLMDQKKYKECALEQAKKYFKEMSPTALTTEPLIFCHFAQGVGDKIYDKIASFADLSPLLNSALDAAGRYAPPSADYCTRHAELSVLIEECPAVAHPSGPQPHLESGQGQKLSSAEPK